jgi:hypothetical protein
MEPADRPRTGAPGAAAASGGRGAEPDASFAPPRLRPERFDAEQAAADARRASDPPSPADIQTAAAQLSPGQRAWVQRQAATLALEGPGGQRAQMINAATSETISAGQREAFRTLAAATDSLGSYDLTAAAPSPPATGTPNASVVGSLDSGPSAFGGAAPSAPPEPPAPPADPPQPSGDGQGEPAENRNPFAE